MDIPAPRPPMLLDSRRPRNTAVRPRVRRKRRVGWLFNIVLFAAIAFPIPQLLSFELFGVITNVSELAVLLLPAIYLFYPRPAEHALSPAFRKLAFAFLAALVVVEGAKMLGMFQSPGEVVRELRKPLLLLSVLLVVVQGIKIRPHAVLITLLLGATCSFVLTPLSSFMNLDYLFLEFSDAHLKVEVLRHGRFYCKNLTFCLLGVALLFQLRHIPRGEERWFSGLIIAAAVGSLVALMLTANRTMLLSTVLLVCVAVLLYARLRTIVYLGLGLALAASIFGHFVSNSPAMQHQVARRILTIDSPEAALENVYYGKRELLYDAYVQKLSDYWMLGVPFREPLFVGVLGAARWTDISLLNIWLRFGIVPMVMFVFLFLRLFFEIRRIRGRPDLSAVERTVYDACALSLPFYLLASANIDVLVTHHGILFLLLFACFGTRLPEPVSAEPARRPRRVALRPRAVRLR